MLYASPEIRGFIKSKETLYLVAYLCPSGVWTLGWGHTKGVAEGMTCTEAEAEQFLRADIEDAEAKVRRYVRVPLTQEQFDALVAWQMNTDGIDNPDCDLRDVLNAHNYAAAPVEIRRWVYGTVRGKKVKLNGLVTRRGEEAEWFVSGPPGGYRRN